MLPLLASARLREKYNQEYVHVAVVECYCWYDNILNLGKTDTAEMTGGFRTRAETDERERKREIARECEREHEREHERKSPEEEKGRGRMSRLGAMER